MPEFRRKPHRLSPNSYRGRAAHFLTLCVHDRQNLFSNHELVFAILKVLKMACASHSFAIYAYCFLPDHLHLILAGKSESANLTEVMRAFKGAAAAAARKLGIRNLLQKGFYDHVLRNGKAMDEAAWYIFLNPVRAGFVSRPEDWPHSGSCVFEWKDSPAPPPSFCPPWKTKHL